MLEKASISYILWNMHKLCNNVHRLWTFMKVIFDTVFHQYSFFDAGVGKSVDDNIITMEKIRRLILMIQKSVTSLHMIKLHDALEKLEDIVRFQYHVACLILVFRMWMFVVEFHTDTDIEYIGYIDISNNASQISRFLIAPNFHSNH